MWVFAGLRYHENIFIQVREGVVNENVFLSYNWRTSQFYTTPFFPWYWSGVRAQFDPDFVAAFEAEYNLTP